MTKNPFFEKKPYDQLENLAVFFLESNNFALIMLWTYSKECQKPL